MQQDTAKDWEDVRAYTLDEAAEQELLERQTECTFIWVGKDGHPMGVVMNYMFRRGSFWLTATEQRPRIAAVRRDPRVSISITSKGSGITPSRSLSYKCLGTVHDDDETRSWFVPEFARVLRPESEQSAASFAAHLDSPGRVVLELRPLVRIGFDSAKMWKAAPSAAPPDAGAPRAEEGPDVDAAVQVLLDEREITRLCHRYARALDDRDWELLRSCFLPDAVAEYEGLERCEGYQAIEELCRGALARLTRSQHLIGNVYPLVQGDRATSECYLQAQHVQAATPGGDTFIVAGRYSDELVRTEEGWRIARRRLETWWTSGNPAVLGA